MHTAIMGIIFLFMDTPFFIHLFYEPSFLMPCFLRSATVLALWNAQDGLLAYDAVYVYTQTGRACKGYN